jgi:hypothetical protein
VRYHELLAYVNVSLGLQPYFQEEQTAAKNIAERVVFRWRTIMPDPSKAEEYRQQAEGCRREAERGSTSVEKKSVACPTGSVGKHGSGR